MEKKVFIILLNYKGTNDTLACVESLEKIEYGNYEIVIVNNASPDNSLEILVDNLTPRHVVIPSGKNGGFAYGDNVGIKYALSKGADYVLLINTDTLVEPDFLKKLVATAEANSSSGIITGKAMYESLRNVAWYCGGEINWKRFYGYHYPPEKAERDSTEIQNITFATGCLMLIKKEVLEKVGLLSEEYFMYYEDVDFCANVLEAGYSILYDPNSIIYHKVSASTGGEESAFAVEWNTRNRIKFIKKYARKFGIGRYYSALIFLYLTRGLLIVKYALRGRRDKIRALIRGILNK